MKPSVTILGTGTVGRTLAAALSTKNYPVTIGTRNPEDTMKREGANSFGEWHASNSQIGLESFDAALRNGEIIFNALNGNSTLGVLKQCSKEHFNGKVMIDVSNPLDFSKGFPPTLLSGLNNTGSLGEAIQELLPQCKVVKSLNTMWCGLMLNPGLIKGNEHVNFISGNDNSAKEKVSGILIEFGWKKDQLIDLGEISASRGTEGYLLLWTRIYGATKNGAFNISLQK